MKNLSKLFYLIFLFIPFSFLCAQNLITQQINENWKFKQVRGNNWYSATVPGVVHTDLMDNQIIEDPFYCLNERGVQWVDKEDWEYKCSLSVDNELFEKQNIELCFEGLDTYADVYLNDSLILNANNMFRSWNVNIKNILKKDSNELRIYFHSALKIDIPKFDALDFQYETGNDQSENGGIFDKKVGIFARKAAYHYGWDWGPRLVTSGIWRPIELIGWDDVKIDNVQYIQEKISSKKADIKAVVQFEADKSGLATVSIKTNETKTDWEKTVSVQKGINKVEISIVINQPNLWWSNGLGEAHLYNFTTSVSMNNSKDSKTERIGLRDIQVIRDKDEFGTSFYFRLNGVNVFMKGANYIPQHSFLTKVTDSMYEKTILDAVNANMNMLRVWGGGIYENDIFYDLCDQYGILVWQDFMFACALYPTEGDLLENVRQEAIENVIRLRNHPSIALWCGNNENSAAWFGWGYKRKYTEMGKGIADIIWKQFYDCYFVILPNVVEANDTRFYWPSSPYNGDPYGKPETGKSNWNPNGDGHYWGVWHGKDSITNYNIVRCRFMSEYGFQSFPEYQSVLKYAPKEQHHDIYSEVMMLHQRGGKHANSLIEWYLLNEYQKPKDFENFLYLGQLLQGDAIKTAIEAHRRDMPYCMGTLFWQHNDCWPVASWSSRDFYGRWKAQHYFSKKAFEDVLVSPILKDEQLDVYVVSDRLHSTKGILTISVMDFKGKILFQQSKNITVKANCSEVYFSKQIAELLKGKQKNEVFIQTTFKEKDNEKVCSNNYFLTRYKNIDFPKANITFQTSKTEDGFNVSLQSDVFARGVFLSLEGIDNFFSDNYFDLLPNQKVTINVTTKLNKTDFEQQLKVVSISDSY